MFATLAQCYKTFYQGYLLPFYGIYCNSNVFLTQNDSITMEWR
jgi:hypothetical protein